MLPGSLVPVLMLLVAALLVAGGVIVASTIFGPKRRTPVKQMPYESGMDPIGDARGRFDVRFHLMAILFLIFDVELLFIYPWAIAAWNAEAGLQTIPAELGIGPTEIFLEILLFIGLLGVGYAYAWKRGVFNWRA